QKRAYITAAHGLTTHLSPRNPNITVHDEFSYLHSRIGNYSHNGPQFLPWHRYFLHAYENALKQYSNYTGPLPYWDWSLDYRNLTGSPVWNIDDGFGPSGSSSPSVGTGGCVDQGPFANWAPAYYDGVYHPHCLSRGFLDAATVARVGNLTVRPDALKRVIRKKQEYFDFLMAVETMSHLTIPYVVQGDFVKVTAPNDPRLWEYGGMRNINSTYEDAAVDDVMQFGDFLGPEGVVTVMDVMDTERGFLCYTYDSTV
ncbi:Di-copper centre-containing protein, partial [Aspergillus steynii IBT 23096]